MMDPSPEKIEGPRILEMLNGLLHSRRTCRMDIPRTDYGWITLLLGVHREGKSHYLLVDRVSGFERALAQSRQQEISIEYLEGDGVPCRFLTRVVESRSGGILTEFPSTILRMQKRRFFRIKARSGTEILFKPEKGKTERAKVKDYSLGGIAFFPEASQKVNLHDPVSELELSIPQGDRWITFHIPQAVVRRKEKDFMGREICALLFQDLPEVTKESLWRHIFEEERVFLQRTKK